MSVKRSSVQKLVMALAVVALLAVPLAGMVSAADQPSGITAPADGATVSGVVEAAGYADTEKFSRWVLELLPAGDAANNAYLTSGVTPGAWTYALDTTVFPAGEHALRLRAVKPDGNYQEAFTKFTIAN